MAKTYHPRIVICTFIVVAAAMVLCLPAQVAAAAPQAVSGSDLIEKARSYNGQEIVFEGEVIGDIMPRGDHVWVNVLNGSTAIGVWISAGQRADIRFAGRYGIQGDRIRIVGHFNQACSEHGGDLDIHAISVETLAAGRIAKQALDIKQMVIAGILFVIAVGSLYILIKKQFKRK
jgi:hypothetical protein